MTVDPDFSAALDPLRSMLAADGYAVELGGGVPVAITIVATGDACGDCLVPESVMRPLIADMLGGAGVEEEWTLSLPVSAGH